MIKNYPQFNTSANFIIHDLLAHGKVAKMISEGNVGSLQKLAKTTLAFL